MLYWGQTKIMGGLFLYFFDLTKVFDSVPHKPLLNCLSAIDLPSALLIWLNNYLFDRSQQVVVNGSTGTSSKSHVSSGVPQGSILGPLLLLFTLMILLFSLFLPHLN